ncbi:Leucine-rich repeat-containing 40-like protein [Cladobotryum mycophilum]|uniref:Leucine-rich repeat-containing 40-like protein n=1 Tax=Cladobotryum mycophilum TaxID=491253 RepID=A0ABR0STK7_9HYPO
MSGTQDRSSSIPRLSRLPRPTSSIPKHTLPSTSTSSLRPQPSRESLSGRITPVGDIQNPKLRHTASRNSLRSSSSNSDVQHTYVRQCASRDQLRPGGSRTASLKAAAPPPTKSTRTASTSRRWSTVTNNPTSQYKPWADPRSSDPGRDSFVRGSTPAEDVPELLLTSYLNGTLGNSGISEDAEPLSASSDGAFSEPGRIRSKKSRPSLSERTMETLAHIPSSPTMSRKSSTFFDQSRRGSLAEGFGFSNYIETSYINESRFIDIFTIVFRTKSDRREESKPVQKLTWSSPFQDLTAHDQIPNGPSSAGWDGTIRSPASALSNDAEAPAFVKSSSALRDQIARAKAAKRAAMKYAGGDEVSSVGNETIAMSPVTGFDYDSVYVDPFNQNKGGNNVLKQRVNAARTSGRLNIAALGLKEIPSEVMKMYDYESIQESGGNWAESVDVTRFIAADNELETLDDAVFPDRSPESFDDDEDTPGNIFGGLETVDMHGNKLTSVPVGMRRLAHLTSLNLSANRLDNDCIAVISQITSLRDLKLAKNCLAGPLDSSLSNLNALETLDIHGNQVSSLPLEIEKLERLRILILSDNNFESIGFEGLAKLPLTELDLKRNKLSGTLIEDPIESLPLLQTFDVSSNRLTRLVPEGVSISLPVLHTLLVSMNRFQELPDMSTWSNLLTLTADTNNISVIHESFASLMKLRQADFSGNDIKVVLPEIARMESLSMLRLGGNPLRDKKFASISTDEIKVALAGRLEPPPPYQEPAIDAPLTEAMGQLDMNKDASEQGKQDGEYKSDEDEHFATPQRLLFNLQAGGIR